MSLVVDVFVVAMSLRLFTFQPCPGRAHKQLVRAGFHHYYKFWELREHFRVENLQLFQLTQKAHSCQHACLLSNVLNPRFSWCYKFEDFMGAMRILSSSCTKVGGRAAKSGGTIICNKIVDKWREAFHLLLKDPHVMIKCE